MKTSRDSAGRRKWRRIYLDRWTFLHLWILVLAFYFIMITADWGRFFIVAMLQWSTIAVIHFTRE
jgi:hypothetical protein